MTTVPGESQPRLHAIDNLRATLMWLGIVLHASINYMTGPSLLPFKDVKVTPLADLLLMFIHAFRMPAFFLLAGFLAAMMVATRGYRAMMKNRVRRIALPFAVFWPLMLIGMVLLVMQYRHLMFFGTFGFDLAVAPKASSERALFNTMHMWFLYYLFIFCALAALACALQARMPTLQRAFGGLFDLLAARWWGALALSVPLAIVGSFYRSGILAQNGSFIPNLPEIVHSGIFFVFGWAVYRNRAALLEKYARQCWTFALAGLASYFASGALLVASVKSPGAVPHTELLIGYCYGLTGWLWSIAVLGIFLRYLPHQNRALRYLSDSSYWVFMVHMIGTIGFGALLFKLDAPAEIKLVINIAATTLACLATYHLFVRNTWVGVLLNGQRRNGRTAPQAYPASV